MPQTPFSGSQTRHQRGSPCGMLSASYNHPQVAWISRNALVVGAGHPNTHVKGRVRAFADRPLLDALIAGHECLLVPFELAVGCAHPQQDIGPEHAAAHVQALHYAQSVIENCHCLVVLALGLRTHHTIRERQGQVLVSHFLKMQVHQRQLNQPHGEITGSAKSVRYEHHHWELISLL